jgi:polar amino acid transport system substrate-binding protein
MRQKARILVVMAAVLLAAACGSAGKPTDPAPVGRVDPPQPAHVGGADQQGGPATQNNCNALASLSPSKSIAPGSTMAKIQSAGKLTVGVDQTSFLTGFRNPISGNLEGFDIDMAKQVAAALFGTAEGHIQFKAISSSQRVDALKNHQVDMVVRTFSITCDRLKDINFSSVYYLAGQRILVDKGSKITKLSDLAGKKVCATKSSTSLTKIAADPSKPIPVSVDNWSDCLVMLQQSQVDAVSTDDVILAGMAAQDPTVKVVGARFTDENYGIGIPKDNDDMVRYVNAVLEDVRNGGAWKSSYNLWLAPSLGDASPPNPVYK